MLTDQEKQRLESAFEGLKQEDGPWQGIAPLAQLAQAGTDISIDFSTQATLGAPVIIANRRIAPPAELTPRQAEVCKLIAQGLSNKAIAAILGISPATVKDHVHAILDRLGLKGRAEVVAHLHRRQP